MATTKPRFIRINDDLWEKAQRKAERQGTNVSTVVRGLLIGYVDDEQPTPTLKGETAST